MSTTSRTCPPSMRRPAASSVRTRVYVDSVPHPGEASSCDSLVEQRDLLSVHPGGWDPFRQSVGVHPTGPAAASEIVVVITTEQGQIPDSRVAAPSRVTV